MQVIAYSCLTLTILTLSVQIITCALATARFQFSRRPSPQPRVCPSVTLVRPLCGLEPYSQQTLTSTFDIEYPNYEIIFCVDSADDPIVPLVRKIITAHSQHRARLLIGKDPISANPKLNNMLKGFRDGQGSHIVFVDSNVYTPPDYLAQLVNALDRGAGLVSAPPVGQAPNGPWSEIECAFLNTYQARFQYFVDMLGFGFAQGKTLFFRRETLENGRFEMLASEPAEDAAATKLIRGRGERIRLAGPFSQLIGPRTARQMWNRQLRWARLRRASFPLLYAGEILAGGFPSLLSLVLAAWLLDIDVAAPAFAFMVLWYAPELFLARVAGWPRSLTAMLLRDFLLPCLFVAGCVGNGFEWHGHRMNATQPKRKEARVRRVGQRLGWLRHAKARFIDP